MDLHDHAEKGSRKKKREEEEEEEGKCNLHT